MKGGDSHTHQKRAAAIAAVVGIISLGVIAIFDGRMRATGGPGILSLEFARTGRRATEILRQWGSSGIHAARWANAIDYVFILAYVRLLFLAVCGARRRADRGHHPALTAIGGVVVFLPFIAGLFDGTQNGALLVLLAGHSTAATAEISFACGAATALLALTTLVYVAAARLAGGRHG